ncbi:hypothetical protein MKY96_19440 [Paenibacillus sp. FSL R7-0302]|uniref:hypothetical protein n=1 Tax=Paenibacillus sp. FSL R7-0302 TaxID=2921681 RepID=UPI0030FC5FB1
MAEILSYNNENNATIFKMKELSWHARLRIIKEFHNDYSEHYIGRNYIKLINPKKSVLEISDNLITFFPQLSAEIAELNKKRIYKLIAQRSEIYISNSIEKIELSTSRLLGKDLRATASLLYYSFHNFTTGKMYQFLSEKNSIDEYNVTFNEVDHFTSQLFFNDIFKKQFNLSNFITDEINQDNYTNNLCTGRNKHSANPFKIVPLVLLNIDQSISVYLDSYINYLYKELFGEKFSTNNIDTLENFINSSLKNRTKDKAYKQELEVKASIAFAYKSFIETNVKNERITWSFYIIALRLYWLRQTADYDYDFEVKTSTREISLLLNAIQQYYKLCEFTTFAKKEVIIDDIESKKNLQNPISQQSPINQQSISIEKTYFQSDIKELMNSEINSYLCMTALHLDSDFCYDEIVSSINFTHSITNRAEYYIYELLDPLPVNVNVKLDKDGRWTLWVNKDSAKYQVLSENDLIVVFDRFCDQIFNNYREYENPKYIPQLCVSYPNYTIRAETHDSLKIETIYKMSNSIMDRNAWIIKTLLSDIKEKFKLTTQFPNIIIEQYRIYFRVNFGLESTLLNLPLSIQINSEAFKGNSKTFILNFHIDIDDEKSPRHEGIELLEVFKNINNPTENELYNILTESDDISKAFYVAGVIEIKPTSLNHYLKGDNHQLFYSFTQYLNLVSHELIINNSFDASKKFLEICLSYDKCESFAYATMGLWYFRNTDMDVEICEQQGKYYYELALDKVNTDHADSEIDLKQRYYYELALFYFRRNINYEMYTKYYNDGINLGKYYSYTDLLVLNETFDQIASSKQTSTNKIIKAT